MHEKKYIDVTLKMRVSSYKYIETANLYFGETVGIAKIEEISKNASLLHKKHFLFLFYSRPSASRFILVLIISAIE